MPEPIPYRAVLIEALEQAECDWFESIGEAAGRILDAFKAAGYEVLICRLCYGKGYRIPYCFLCEDSTGDHACPDDKPCSCALGATHSGGESCRHCHETVTPCKCYRDLAWAESFLNFCDRCGHTQGQHWQYQHVCQVCQNTGADCPEFVFTLADAKKASDTASDSGDSSD